MPYRSFVTYTSVYDIPQKVLWHSEGFREALAQQHALPWYAVKQLRQCPVCKSVGSGLRGGSCQVCMTMLNQSAHQPQINTLTVRQSEARDWQAITLNDKKSSLAQLACSNILTIPPWNVWRLLLWILGCPQGYSSRLSEKDLPMSVVMGSYINLYLIIFFWFC